MAEYTIVHSKLSKELHAQLVNYCQREGIKPYGLIRQLVEERVNGLVPIHNSGINILSYVKKDDSFRWEVRYDDGRVQLVAESLSPEFIQDLSGALVNGISSREDYIKKGKKGSVAVPSLKRLIEVKRHA